MRVEEKRVEISAENVMKMTVQDIMLALDNNNKIPIMAVMQRLQQLGYNWRFMNKMNKTLLHFAAEEGDCEAIKALLDARVFHVNEFENVLYQGYNYPSLTALYYACREDHFEAVKLLISYGADVTIRGQVHSPLILESIQADNTEIFDYLLRVGLSVQVEDRMGNNCLDLAAGKGNVPLLNRLLEMGFDPNRKSPFMKMTIFHEACRDGKSVAMLKRIMELKLNPFEPCVTYERPIDMLFSYGTRETLDLAFSAYGGDIFKVGPRGDSPMHYACTQSNLEAAQWLVEKGSSVDQPTNLLDKCPLQLAIEASNPAMIELLVKLGANKSVMASNGDTLLIFAVKRNDLPAVDSLLRAGFNPNEPSVDRKATPLDCACGTGNISLINLLLDRGADINGTDSEGWTALHKMALLGNPQIVFHLLQRGANADAKDSKQYSPLDLARDETIMQMLQERGANRVGSCTQLYKLVVCCFCCECCSEDRF